MTINSYGSYYKNSVKNDEAYIRVEDFNGVRLIKYQTDIFHIVMDYFKSIGQYHHKQIQMVNTPEKFFNKFRSKLLTPKTIVMRLSWEILISNPHNKYVITINNLGDQSSDKSKCRKILYHFIHRLRQRSVSRKPSLSFDGFVAEEPCRNDSFHYHIIITDPNCVLTDSLGVFQCKVDKTVESLNKTAANSNLLTHNSTICIPDDCYDVKAYEDRKIELQKSIEGYITKEFERGDKYSNQVNISDFMGLISPLDENGLQQILFG